MVKRLHLCIRGRVQGVAFRAHTVAVADRLGLTGWVRNRADGSVDLVAEGTDGALRELLVWSRRGPSSARVDAVDETWEEATGEFASFGVR